MTASATPYVRTDNTRLGIVMIMGSVTLFAVMNVLVKLLTADYPINQVVFFRSAFALIPAVMAIALQRGWSDLRTAHPAGHMVRAMVGLSSMILIFWSFQLLSLGEAIALNFTTPLFLTALSVPLLGERVGPHRWSAVLVGFVGVLILAQPSPQSLNLGVLVGVLAALCQAGAMVAIRQLSRTETPNTIVFYFTAFCTVLIALTLPFSWVAPDGHGLLLLVATGLIGGCAQLCMTRAYSLAPAAVVAPFSYASLLFAVVFGWILWDEVPTSSMAVGAAVVAASGLYILHRETRRSVIKPASNAPSGGD